MNLFFLIETEQNTFLFFLYEGMKGKQEKLENKSNIKIVVATYAQLKKDYPKEFRIKENL